MKKIFCIFITFFFFIIPVKSIKADSDYQQLYIINQSSNYINYLITFDDSAYNSECGDLTKGQKYFFMSGNYDPPSFNTTTVYDGFISNKLGANTSTKRHYVLYRPLLGTDIDLYLCLADYTKGYFADPHIHINGQSSSSVNYYVIIQDDGIYLSTTTVKRLSTTSIAVKPEEKIADGIVNNGNNQRLQNVVFNLQNDIPLTIDGSYYLDGKNVSLHKTLNPYEAFVLESDFGTRVKWDVSPIVTYFYHLDEVFTSNWNTLELNDEKYGSPGTIKTRQFGYALMRVTYPYYWHISNDGLLTIAPADFEPSTIIYDTYDSPYREYRLSNTWLNNRIQDNTLADGLGALFIPRAFFMGYPDSQGKIFEKYQGIERNDIYNSSEQYLTPLPTHIADDPFRLYAKDIKEVRILEGIHWYSIDNLLSSLDDVEKISLPSDWPSSENYSLSNINDYYTPGQFTLSKSEHTHTPYGSPFYVTGTRELDIKLPSFNHNLPGDNWLNSSMQAIENTNSMIPGVYTKKTAPSFFIEIPPAFTISNSALTIYGKGSDLNNINLLINCDKNVDLFCGAYKASFKTDINKVNGSGFNDSDFSPIANISFTNIGKILTAGKYEGIMTIEFSAN